MSSVENIADMLALNFDVFYTPLIKNLISADNLLNAESQVATIFIRVNGIL